MSAQSMQHRMLIFELSTITQRIGMTMAILRDIVFLQSRQLLEG